MALSHKKNPLKLNKTKNTSAFELKKEIKKLNEHLDGSVTKLRKYKQMNSTRNAWIVCLCFWVVASVFIVHNFDGNVDEAGLCETKLAYWFPEYNFHTVEQYSDNNGDEICKGYYTSQIGESRDGLVDITDTIEDQIKRFKLTDQADIDFVQSDNISNLLLGFGCFLFCCGLVSLWANYDKR